VSQVLFALDLTIASSAVSGAPPVRNSHHRVPPPLSQRGTDTWSPDRTPTQAQDRVIVDRCALPAVQRRRDHLGGREGVRRASAEPVDRVRGPVRVRGRADRPGRLAATPPRRL